MTKEELLKYYADLLIIQYRNKPKARSHVELLADLITVDLLPLAVRDAFDLDNAKGVQLDMIGKYMGVSRFGKALEGGTMSLNDTDYRGLIKLFIINNYSDATLYEMKSLLYQYFGGDILLFDYKGMRIGYFLSSSAGSSTLAKFVVANGYLPSPMGVGYSATIFIPNLTNIFGFVSYDLPTPSSQAPFNTYDNFDMNTTWLSYSDTVELGDFNAEIMTEDNMSTLLTESGKTLVY